MNRTLPTLDTPALSIRGLSHSFGARRVLDNVDICIKSGQFTVLLGLNGAGKTTLYSLITRLYINRIGHIRIFGVDLLSAAQLALARIGVVFQQPTLDLDLTVSQNMHYHCRLHGIGPKEGEKRIHEGLERIGMTEALRDKARHLSGGQRRRVEIARALLHRPDLLLLDEPSVGLDIDSRAIILNHVRHLCREENLAVFWATHLIDEVDENGHIVILHRGRVLARESAKDFMRHQNSANMSDAFAAIIDKNTAPDTK